MTDLLNVIEKCCDQIAFESLIEAALVEGKLLVNAEEFSTAMEREDMKTAQTIAAETRDIIRAEGMIEGARYASEMMSEAVTRWRESLKLED